MNEIHSDDITITLPVVTYHVPQGSYPIDPYEEVPEDRCVCGEDLEDGDLVRWRKDRPLHASCYQRHVESMAVPSAWVAIAEDVKRNPSKHSAATVRAVLENLSRLVQVSGALIPSGEGA